LLELQPPTQRFESGALHRSKCQSTARKNQTMDWVPVVFITFKVIVFGTCMFYAIKWHHDQGKKAKEEARLRQEAAERAAGASE
jgi:hypothetical protein